jgi:hypothetical protein
MRPKEKAEELFTLYHNLIQEIGEELGQEILVSILAKVHALNAIDIVIDELTKIPYGIYFINRLDYWNKVKEEIKKL